MNINDFPNPKLNLPKEFKSSKEHHRKATFQAIDQYLSLVGKYIYTDIKLEYVSSDPRHIHAWIQKVVSANVLRSLYLRNSFIESFNARNAVGIYLPLKAWFETVGVLASILNLLKNNLSPKDLLKAFEPYALGNRGESNHRIGSVEAVSVSTMIKNADKYFTDLQKENGNQVKDFFKGFYDTASNPSHPSFDAYEIVGTLGNNKNWVAKEPDEVKKNLIEEIDRYGGLLLSAIFIEHFCKNILKIEEKHFEKLKSKKYFINL